MSGRAENKPDVIATPRDAPAKTSRYRVLGEGSSIGLSAVSIAGLLALWWIAKELVWVKPLFLPKLSAIWLAFQQAIAGDLDGHTLWVHFFWSMYRVFAAFLMAVAIGIPIGIGMGVSRHLRGIFDPPIEFYRPLPPLAYLPLMIIWFGIGEQAKIILLFLAIFAPVALAARAGVRSVSQEQIQAALSLGASPIQVVRHVILPSALPEILVGLRIGMGVGWTTLVAAEMVAADAGSARWSTTLPTSCAPTPSSSASWRLASSPTCSSSACASWSAGWCRGRSGRRGAR